MGITVIPLHRLELLQGQSIPFGTEFILERTPEWVKNDPLIQNLGYWKAQDVRNSNCSLIAEYEANAIGEPDPNRTGPEQRSIQAAKSEAGAMANLAIWLIAPCPVCSTTVLHGIRHSIPGTTRMLPILQQIETHTPLFCHPKDVEKQPSIDEIRQAGELYELVRSVPRGNAVWSALRSTWAGLVMPHKDIRYSMLWIGLEALLGPDSSGSEITYKLSQRIAFLIAEGPSDAKEIFRNARDCYQTRSQIAHGRWKDDPKMDSRMAATETLLRSCLLRVLKDPDLLAAFSSMERDRYLENMVFERYC